MIVVGTTLSAMAMSDDDAWRGWLLNAEQLAAETTDDVRFFAAIEVDGRGLFPFLPLTDELEHLYEMGIHFDTWVFSLDDGRTENNFSTRLRHITAGQNLATDYAVSTGASHLLFMAADCAYEPDALNRLVAVDVPVIGAHVPTYCLDGPPVPELSEHGDIREHMPTAAFVLLRRDFFRFHRWRWDLDAGMSDDPCLEHDAYQFFNTRTLVHHDVVGRHYPEAIGSYESRGYDTEVVW